MDEERTKASQTREDIEEKEKKSTQAKGQGSLLPRFENHIKKQAIGFFATKSNRGRAEKERDEGRVRSKNEQKQVKQGTTVKR